MPRDEIPILVGATRTDCLFSDRSTLPIPDGFSVRAVAAPLEEATVSEPLWVFRHLATTAAALLFPRQKRPDMNAVLVAFRQVREGAAIRTLQGRGLEVTTESILTTTRELFGMEGG